MQEQKSRTIAKNAAIFGFALVLGKIIGFTREVVLAALYGTGPVSDAFVLANSGLVVILGLISTTIASGLIPVYSRAKDKAGFLRNVMTCLLALGLLFAAIFTAIPGVLVKLLAFRASPEVFALAVHFTLYIAWASPFILLTEVYNAHLEIEGDFFAAGMCAVWRNLVVVTGVAIGAWTGQAQILAISVVAGYALGMFLLSVRSRRYGFVYRPHLNLRSPELRQILSLTGPIFLSVAVADINQIIDKNFAASLTVGTVSALNYSGKVKGIFVALIGQSLFTVMFPYMSQLVTDGKIDKLKKALVMGVMNMVAVILPLCIGVIILAEPGVRILFERGEFTRGDTVETAACLRMYALSMVSAGMSALVTRAFYSLHNTKTPAGISVMAVLVNIALNFYFIRFLGAKGLALSTSIASLFSSILLLVFLRKATGRMGLRSTVPELAKICVSAAIMGAVAYTISGHMPLMAVSAWKSAVYCLVVAAAGGAVYVGLLFLLKSKTVFRVMDEIKGITGKRENRVL